MYPLFLVELGTAADELLAMRGGEEDGTVDVAEVALFHMVLLGFGFEH
jgi:hypothetical protein